MDDMPMPMTPGSDMNMSSSSMDMMMHMTFYWGKDAIILFSGWPNDNLGVAGHSVAVFFIKLRVVAGANPPESEGKV
ncbi:Ctr copper transporter family [Euphorbia peplus]|nr:Ctr copper transporter family [Euphorbia peplus]